MEIVELLDGLAQLPPGPELTAVLAGIDSAGVAGRDMPVVLITAARQLAFAQAQVWSAMVALSHADPDDVDSPPRCRDVGGWAGGEIAAALTLTGTTADTELHLATVVFARLPLLGEAMTAGELSRDKARLFVDYLDDLPDEQATSICAQLVPVAPGLTTGQLRERLRRAVQDIDPDYARRRYRRAIRERGVTGYLAEDGTMTITGTGLPADEAAAACARLDVLAHAIRRAGHPCTLTQIQTDLYLGMLDGSLHQLTEQQIIDSLLARPRPEDSTGQPDTGETDDVPADAATGAGPDSEMAANTADPGSRTGVEIRAGLFTLLGLDHTCGEIPGHGPVLPDVARKLVAAQHRGAQWRFGVTDSDGYLVFAGITRHRPIPVRDGPGRSQGGIVEIHASLEELDQLTTNPMLAGRWAKVLIDITAQYQRFRADPEAWFAALEPNPNTRLLRGPLGRYVQIRDRNCTHPGCRRSAYTCELDHTQDYAAGGGSTHDNGGPACPCHHHWKSRGWWHLEQPRPGHFHWKSPLHQIYRTRGNPIRPPTISPTHPRPADPDSGSAGRQHRSMNAVCRCGCGECKGRQQGADPQWRVETEPGGDRQAAEQRAEGGAHVG